MIKGTLPPFNRRGRLAWLVMALSLLASLLLWHRLTTLEQRNGQEQFELQAKGIVGTIQRRMARHEQILLGGAGLFDASGSVSRRGWHAYVERLRLAENYPGIQGVGFAQAIRRAELPGHVAAVRAEGFPSYAVRPPGEREIYTPIKYLEPFTGRNLAAFGYDMYSESTRRAAMAQAVDRGINLISAKVKLVQETHGKTQAGFLMYVPVYAGGAVPETPAQRWQLLRGFVYSPFRADDLMRGIVGDRGIGIDFTIHDGATESQETLMHSSADDRLEQGIKSAKFTTQDRVSFYGRDWTIRLYSRPEFEAHFQSNFGWGVLALGIFISLSLLWLTWSLIARREQALAMARDMTSELRESEGRFREILENCPTAARIALAGGRRIVFYNRRYTELLNVAPGQAAGLDPSDFYANPADYASILDALARGDTVRDRLVELHIPGSGVKWALASFFQLQHDGQPAVLGWFHDITERKQMEERAKDRENRVEAIVKTVVDGIVTIDSLGIVETFNPAAENIFGYAPSEVIGQNVRMLMPEPYRGEHDGYLRNYLDTGKAKVIGIGREVTGRRKDGANFPMELAVSEMQVAGKRMFTGIVRDITERKKIDQMKSQFVSTVSHELRTPLTAIRGALGLVSGGALGAISEQAMKLIQLANQNCERLMHLINDLLDMEKITAGKMEFDMQAHDLSTLVAGVVEANRGVGAQAGIEFRLHTGTSAIPVRMDGPRFAQVLSNFLSNAAKFSPPQGAVDVRLSLTGLGVRVSVQDHGPGIPDEFRGKIFQRFSQADASNTRAKEGTGLGLAITKELVERMGGVIGFDSINGAGATFWCEFPLYYAGDRTNS